MSGGIAERAWCVVVPHQARGARVARHRLAASLTDLVGPELLSDATTVVAELVGNSVRHAQPLPGAVVRVAWRLLRGGVLEIRVTDGGAASGPTPRQAAPDAVNGRGLAIIGVLAEDWGVERDGLGQCVWAELRDRPEPSQQPFRLAGPAEPHRADDHRADGYRPDGNLVDGHRHRIDHR
jgi:anti-sigma regulatory factor (Ser/Thr protein kinase)